MPYGHLELRLFKGVSRMNRTDKDFTCNLSLGDDDELSKLIREYLQARDRLSMYLSFDCEPTVKIEAASGN